MKRIHKILKPWYIIVLLLFLWWLASELKLWNTYLMPPPAKVLKTFLSMWRKGEIARAVAVSLRRVLTGFLISFGLAFVCGVITAYAPKIAGYFRYLGNFFRNVPPLALISLLILWFGLGETPKLIIIVLASFFPMLLNISSGFIRCDVRLLEVGKSLGFTGIKRFFRISLPAARLDILTGIRIGLGYAWRALIGAEMFAAAAGLGYMIVFAQQMSRSDKVFIGIILIGLIGSLTDSLLQALIGRLSAQTEQAGENGGTEFEEPKIGTAEHAEPKTDAEEHAEPEENPTERRLVISTTAGHTEDERPHPLNVWNHANDPQDPQEKSGAEERFWSEVTTIPSEPDGKMHGGSHTDNILLKEIHKSFPTGNGSLPVLQDLNLEIPANEITVVLGKSGCGKTTLLRLISGLDPDYEGSIHFPADKKCAVVFQESRLMPWLDVRRNIAFGLKKKEVSEKRIRELFQLTGLTGFERVRPAQLSGGMEQRAAIARALAVNPEFLLMDEPFAALDYFTRGSMQQALLDIQRKTGCGILFITHSIDEALILADNIVILKDHKVHKKYRITGKNAGLSDSHPEQRPAEQLHSICTLKEEILQNI